MQLPTVLLFLLTCSVGSVIQTVSGFGFGIFVMSIFPYFMPSYAGGVAISSMLSLTTTVLIAFRYRRSVLWNLLPIPMSSFVVFSTLAIYLSGGQSDALLKKLLGIVLIGMSIYFLFFSAKIKLNPTLLNSILAGGLGGFLNGMFGMGGPPMVVYLLSVSKSNEEYLGTIQTYFAITNLYTIFLRILNGTVTVAVVQYWLFGIAAVLAGMLLGRKIFSALNPLMLKKVVYVFMALSGATMLIK